MFQLATCSLFGGRAFAVQQNQARTIHLATKKLSRFMTLFPLSAGEPLPFSFHPQFPLRLEGKTIRVHKGGTLIVAVSNIVIE